MTTSTITKVPMLDLEAQYEPIKDQVMAAMKEVFDSKRFILGPKVEELEKKMAEYCDVKHAIGLSSGTDALLIALMALGIGNGDEVITTTFSFFATAGSIARVGAKPVFVDIDPDSYNIDPGLIEQKITAKTKAIMPVHIFGQMADMEPILAIAKKHNLYVIEDAAQAIGSRYQAKDGQWYKAGTMGDIGCFSFFPSKNLGCCGDGGMVTTNSDELAEILKQLRTHGGSHKYYNNLIGGNFRLDALQAAVLLVKLPYLEAQHEGRRKNAFYYDKALKGVIKTPLIPANSWTIYNQYTLRTDKRDELKQALDKANIGNAVYYPIPLHLQNCFQDLGYKEGDCFEAERAVKEVISIPVYSELIDAQMDYVIEVIKFIA